MRAIAQKLWGAMEAKDEEAFREFVGCRSAVLLKVALLLSGGDQGAAEDLLQNALIKVANRWQRIEEPEPYVRQVLYRQQISRWRLVWRSREHITADVPEPGRGADSMQAAELRIDMARAMRKLTARQRTMLVLRYYEDLPEAEVAALLGCSVGTVRSTTQRSLAKLRDLSPELSARRSGAGQTPSRQSLSEVLP